MLDEQTKQEIRSRLLGYLETVTKKSPKAGRDNMYNCPFCGSGTGKNGTGAIKYYPETNTFFCHKCHAGGDIFDLVALIHKLDRNANFPKIAQIAAQAVGIVYDTQLHNIHINAQHTHNGGSMKAQTQASATAATPKDFTAYLKQCSQAVAKTDFFTQRGFTAETIARFNLGFDESKNAAVIPYNNGTYFISRFVSIPANEKSQQYGNPYRKPSAKDAGAEPLFNIAALDIAAEKENPLFVCESQLDAISIEQAGGAAVSINGAGNAGKLWDRLDTYQGFCSPVIIATDADEPGRKAADAIADGLKKRNIPFCFFPYPQREGKTDVNALLMENAETFKQTIAAAQTEALTALRDSADSTADETERYNRQSGAARIDAFIEQWESGRGKAIPTGFPSLDKVLDGGLFPGLYTIGAISSLGKTTLTLQIADQIAAAGYDILFFSLEMAAAELTAKSISRLTAQCSINAALTYRDLTNQERRTEWAKDAAKSKAAADAIARYRTIAENVFVVEGMGDVHAETIKSKVKQHIRARGKTPVVFVDYVQIMAAQKDGLTDKQSMDKNIVELKRISRDYNTPVFAISSFNRDNYSTFVSLASFKESGAIEYTADVVLGLQPVGMEEGNDGKTITHNIKIIRDCKQSEIRQIEAVILKNRNGGIGTANFAYNTQFNILEDKGQKTKEQTSQVRNRSGALSL